MTDARTDYERRWMALALLAMTQFVIVLDMTIVVVALPSIGEDLGFSQENLPWVLNAYVLAFGGFLLLGGRAADLLGRRRVFMVGLVVFGLASLACGLSQSEGMLIAARAAQGLGGAILAPAALSLVAATFSEGAERNSAMGVWGAVSGGGGAAGVLLGGVLTGALGWEWVFWVNVPITLAGAITAPALLAEGRAETVARRFDLLGAFTLTAGLSMLVYALIDAGEAGWGSTRTIWLLLVALVLLGAFVLVELRSTAPLVPFGFFRLRGPTSANVAMLLFAAGVFGMNYFFSLYMQQVLGYSPLQAGLAFLPMAAGIVGFSGIASRLVTRFGVRPVMVAGLVFGAAGLAWFGAVSTNGSFLTDILGPSVVFAFGGAMASVAVTISAVAGVPERDSGLAGGLVNTSQQVGSALGLAVLATLAASRIESASGGTPDPVTLTDGFRIGFLGGAGFALVAALAALVLAPRVRVTIDGAPLTVEEAAEATSTRHDG